MTLESTHRSALLDLCWRVIQAGLDGQEPGTLEALPAADPMAEHRASFVTLTRGGVLRGCCGSVQAHRPLMEDVAANAWRTAFADPRFAPLSSPEIDGLRLDLSILSDMQPVAAASADSVLAALEPGRHGLMIAAGTRRATFLPKVWESLPDPQAFLHQLRLKAGLGTAEWPDDMRAWLYTTECFGEDSPGSIR